MHEQSAKHLKEDTCKKVFHVDVTEVEIWQHVVFSDLLASTHVHLNDLVVSFFAGSVPTMVLLDFNSHGVTFDIVIDFNFAPPL